MKRNYKLAWLLSVALLSGCASQSASMAENAETDVIRVAHAFGETVLTEKPERVAAIAWGNQDTALALGIAPVGTSKGNFGALGKHGLSPWTEEGFARLKVKPTVFDDTDGLDFEAIAAAKPDVILAAYSGITQKDYDILTQIAPVIAYPKQPWQTLWREQTLQNALGMGMENEGKRLIKDREALIQASLRSYPDIKGKTGAFLWLNAADTSQFYVYLPSDPRAAYLMDLGLRYPQSLQKLAEKTKDFSISLSAEQAELLQDVEVIVTYGDEKLLPTLQKDPLFGNVAAIAKGAVAIIDEKSVLAGAATPTILSIPATIDDYLKLLHDALQAWKK